MLSIKFNGKWLEAQVPGFQVISVSGRELMSYDVNEKKIPGIDGASYTGSEIGSRDIEVTYRLCAPMLEARQIRMNKLNSLLKAREAQLIFADELDKYFIASSAEADGSKIVFHCSDPFKYSTTEKAIPITGNTLTITNNGTVSASVRYEIKLNKENGYLGIASNQGAMEFGKREEANGQTYQQTEYLAGLPDFIAAADDKTSKDAMHPTYGTKGTLTTRSYNGRTYLTLGSVGTLVALYRNVW